ncbi:NAD(P)-binding protein [Aeromicrobium sp. 636]|uniref:Pyridine nucleotide-disulfide oxidoreductase domain-containing protein 2 n=1 Tax=Aeromicrobium senzhongii TaxID=2663859 RepID=A0A8I0ETH5_9ACTN|nr:MULTISPECIES: NAD(P)/FAD-dependent oxidoreductase [Aeromicrobium]MBC9225779.1 NAD(P)/FAD-dependent oxidoreductase [Aeromicrobium senzhongii]MCQ3997888.1 NAD(P)-binding protein [Aeromicrobium sp. 636]
MAERVVIVGAGHNGLVAAALLARAGHEVLVLERLDHVGGAAVSAPAFDGYDARLSRFSYLVSLFPQALIDELGLDLELRSRDTASFTPWRRDGRAGGLLVETDAGEATRQSFAELTGDDRAFDAWSSFYDEVSTLAGALAPTLLEPLPHIGDVRDRVPMAIWTDVVEQPLGTALRRRFSDDIVRGVVATDALIGTFASLDDLTLVQNRCFLYHLIGNGTGEWRVPVGGMGAVTSELARVATEAGATIRLNSEVDGIDVSDVDVTIAGDGFVERADRVLFGAAPYVLQRLLGRTPAAKPAGAQLKLNVLLSRLPRLASGVDPRVAFAGTFHLDESFDQLQLAWATAASGDLPPATGEFYCHTLTDRSILGPELRDSEAQTLTYFGLHTPPGVLDAPGAKDSAVARVLAALDAHLAEPIEPLILGLEAKTPSEIERELWMPGGHIFHGDLAWPWLEEGEHPRTPADRWGVATAHPRVLLCGSGARRGGAVSGIGGHNAARAVLESA